MIQGFLGGGHGHLFASSLDTLRASFYSSVFYFHPLKVWVESDFVCSHGVGTFDGSHIAFAADSAYSCHMF